MVYPFNNIRDHKYSSIFALTGELTYMAIVRRDYALRLLLCRNLPSLIILLTYLGDI